MTFYDKLYQDAIDPQIILPYQGCSLLVEIYRYGSVFRTNDINRKWVYIANTKSVFLFKPVQNFIIIQP